jgi:energy-coupling factor transporter ATP-binding protein EcfA2
MASELLGRKVVLATLEALVLEGETLLLYGPIGIGKTTILEGLQRRIERRGFRCGLAPRTERLRDITEALQRAYPDAAGGARRQRTIRGSLRLAAERFRGVLLLDHLLEVGDAAAGFLHSLRGTGLGVLMAADVDHPRDHARVRARGLAYRELRLEPLPGRCLRSILDRQLTGRSLPGELTEKDRRALLRVARGRPGWIARLVAAAREPRYWGPGGLLHEALRADVSVGIARQYVSRLNTRWTGR